MRFLRQPVSEFGKCLCSITGINYCSSLIYNPGFNILELKKKKKKSVMRSDLLWDLGKTREG